jgi:hypothetical protein
MELLFNPVKLLLATAKDVVPVLALLVFFQMVVLRQPIPRPGRIVFGFFLVLLGMACFLRRSRSGTLPSGAKHGHNAHRECGPRQGGLLDGLRVGVPLCLHGGVFHHHCRTLPHRRSQQSPGGIKKNRVGHRFACRRGLGCRCRYLPGHFSHRHRHTALSLHSCRLRHGGHSNRGCTEGHRSAGLRFGWSHHFHGYGSAGNRVGFGYSLQRTGPQSDSGRVWLDCLRQPISNHQRAGLCTVCPVDDPQERLSVMTSHHGGLIKRDKADRQKQTVGNA